MFSARQVYEPSSPRFTDEETKAEFYLSELLKVTQLVEPGCAPAFTLGSPKH